MTPITLATIAPLHRWVGWRNQLRNGKSTKVPFAPLTGELAKADDPAGWASRPEAEAWARTHINGSGGGVGLELGPVEGEDYAFGGIDLDTCRDPSSGTIAPWALEVIAQIASYAEISPSGTGVKTFFRYATADTSVLRHVMGTNHGKQFKRGRREHPPAIELHISNRYFAVTDQRLADTPAELCLVALRTLVWLLTKAGPVFVRDGVEQTELKEPPCIGKAATTTTDNELSESPADNDALHARLHLAMSTNHRLEERWNGSTAGLRDGSRSGMDMSMTSLLKRALTIPMTSGISRGCGIVVVPQNRPTNEQVMMSNRGRTRLTSLETVTLPEFQSCVENTYRQLFIPSWRTALPAWVLIRPALHWRVLVSIASVMNDAWQLQVKQRDDDWMEAPRLWGAIIGDPSVLKSPVIRTCTKPIDVLDAEARKRHELDMRQHEKDLDVWKRDGSNPNERPDEPRLDRYIVEGTTTEALTEILRTDKAAKQRAPAAKVLIRQDEMSEWLAGFDRYRAGGRGGADRGAYLRLYNGGRVTFDRIGRGSFAISNWSGCILGGMQPEPIQRIARKAADDGLLQRFMYCVADRQSEGEDRRPDREAQHRYQALFRALVTLHPPSNPLTGSSTSFNSVQHVVFHADAHQHRIAINNLGRAITAMPDTSAPLKAALGKWPGLFARLALTFHLIEVADARARSIVPPVLTVVPEATARRAANYMREIQLPHLLRAEALMFVTAQTGHARWIAGLILARNKPRITDRDVVQAYKPLRPPEARRERLDVMESLVTVGWLRPEEQANPARPPAAWSVNPLVFSTFAKQARREREARAQGRRELAEAIARADSSRKR